MTIEQLIKVLSSAMENGTIASFRREEPKDAAHFARNFYVVGADGFQYRIEWYVNLITLYAEALSVWSDKITLSSTHPSYKSHLTFSYRGIDVAFMGVE